MIHDNDNGPCACGAWHKPGEISKIMEQMSKPSELARKCAGEMISEGVTIIKIGDIDKPVSFVLNLAEDSEKLVTDLALMLDRCIQQAREDERKKCAETAHFFATLLHKTPAARETALRIEDQILNGGRDE